MKIYLTAAMVAVSAVAFVSSVCFLQDRAQQEILAHISLFH